MAQSIVHNPHCLSKAEKNTVEYSNALIAVGMRDIHIPKNPRESFQVPNKDSIPDAMKRVLHAMKNRDTRCVSAKLPIPTEFSFVEFTMDEVRDILEFYEDYQDSFTAKGIRIYSEPSRINVNGRWVIYNNRVVVQRKSKQED